MPMLSTNSKIVKRILSISLDDLLIQKSFKGLPLLNWYERHNGKKISSGIITFKESEDDNKLSKNCIFLGRALGPGLIDNYYRSFFADMQHGLEIQLNKKALYNKPHPDIKKLIGTNPSPPEVISLRIFGLEFNNKSYRNKYSSRFSVKFYDQFIKETLTQKNLIEALERDIYKRKENFERAIYISNHDAYECFIQNELLQLFNSINNFESFLSDEMNRLKDDFKGFKSINNAYDCANLLFIYNPLFKDVIDKMFKLSYYGAYDDSILGAGADDEIDPITFKQLTEVFGQTSFDFHNINNLDEIVESIMNEYLGEFLEKDFKDYISNFPYKTFNGNGKDFYKDWEWELDEWFGNYYAVWESEKHFNIPNSIMIFIIKNNHSNSISYKLSCRSCQFKIITDTPNDLRIDCNQCSRPFSYWHDLESIIDKEQVGRYDLIWKIKHEISKPFYKLFRENAERIFDKQKQKFS